MAVEPTVYFHRGPWTQASRSIAALRFIEKYTEMIKANDMECWGPGTRWYAPSARFINSDGIVHSGAPEIWAWMRKLFGSFARVGIEADEVRYVRGALELRRGAGEDAVMERVGDVSEADAALDALRGDLLVYEHDMVFYPRRPGGREGQGIRVRRMIEFVVGPEELAMLGEDGMQIWRAKVWWDSDVLKREIEKREAEASVR